MAWAPRWWCAWPKAGQRTVRSCSRVKALSCRMHVAGHRYEYIQGRRALRPCRVHVCHIPPPPVHVKPRRAGGAKARTRAHGVLRLCGHTCVMLRAYGGRPRPTRTSHRTHITPEQTCSLTATFVGRALKRTFSLEAWVRVSPVMLSAARLWVAARAEDARHIDRAPGRKACARSYMGCRGRDLAAK